MYESISITDIMWGMHSEKKISCPTESEVNKYLAIWNKIENLHKPEKALGELFKGCHATNKNEDNVLIKIYALNNAFGIFMLSPVRMAKHIASKNIDDDLQIGNLTVVDKIRTGHGVFTARGTEIDFYSFATKYCSFHNSDMYPIFDSNVKTALIYFKKHCGFEFDGDLRKYEDFVYIIKNFKKNFGLNSSFRDIDKYLYSVGRKLNPPKKKKTKNKS